MTDSFNDPMDCRYFTEETFDYFNKDHYRWKAFNYGFRGWEIIKVEKINSTSKPEVFNRIYAELKKPEI
jgi:hypothetical protein